MHQNEQQNCGKNTFKVTIVRVLHKSTKTWLVVHKNIFKIRYFIIINLRNMILWLALVNMSLLMQIKVAHIKYIYIPYYCHIHILYICWICKTSQAPITICFNVENYCLNYNEFLLFSFFSFVLQKINHPNIVNHIFKRILYRTKKL